MLKNLCMLIMASFFLSCAHHHAEDAHHHHECSENCPTHKAKQVEFDKKCAESIAEGDTHVAGKEDYKIEHGGKVYYFSSKEKMDKFVKNIEKNVQVANENWMKMREPKDNRR